MKSLTVIIVNVNQLVSVFKVLQASSDPLALVVDVVLLAQDSALCVNLNEDRRWNRDVPATFVFQLLTSDLSLPIELLTVVFEEVDFLTVDELRKVKAFVLQRDERRVTGPDTLAVAELVVAQRFRHKNGFSLQLLPRDRASSRIRGVQAAV